MAPRLSVNGNDMLRGEPVPKLADETVPDRRGPWPSAQPSWPRPPWVLSGRILTAWCEMPRELLASAMSPDLLPLGGPSLRTRVRFYDLAYEALGSSSLAPLAPTAGRFRECSVAVPARYREIEGELSLLLWSESETYLTSGREIFGWPIRLAEIDLAGSLWSAGSLPGTSGSAAMRESWGTISIAGVKVAGVSDDPPISLTSTTAWLAPRLNLRRGGLDEDERELLVIRPEVRSGGERYSATGELTFDLAAGHPLAPLGGSETPARYEVSDGFEIVVGTEVELAR